MQPFQNMPSGLDEFSGLNMMMISSFLSSCHVKTTRSAIHRTRRGLNSFCRGVGGVGRKFNMLRSFQGAEGKSLLLKYAV